MLAAFWDKGLGGWNFQVVKTNPAYRAAFRADRDAPEARPILTSFPGLQEALLPGLRRVLATGTPWRGEVFVGVARQWFDFNALLTGDGRITAIFNDATARERQRTIAACQLYG